MTAALLEEITDELYARHTADADAASAARKEYEERRGKVHQDDELWEPWSAAFVEWFVIERVAPGQKFPAAHASLAGADDERAGVIRALLTSQRSLFEVRSLKGRIELLDLLGGAVFSLEVTRPLDGVEVGDVAELRLVGLPSGDVCFGRTFIYHPKAARAAIVERARAMLAKDSTRRDVIDHIAQLRVQVTRYRHMAPARVYELGSRIMG
ncbi:MAG TPA: hypothetical protein VGM90_18470 [Kofleriaceae bacterium]